jgi:hypothetical protein
MPCQPRPRGLEGLHPRPEYHVGYTRAGSEGSPSVLYAMKASGSSPPRCSFQSPRLYVWYSSDMLDCSILESCDCSALARFTWSICTPCVSESFQSLSNYKHYLPNHQHAVDVQNLVLTMRFLVVCKPPELLPFLRAIPERLVV